jgi:AcrR family transcriptional regulator
MEQRERILDAIQDLTLTNRKLPSILEVAAEVGLTKQGVLHYFPTRVALDTAVVLRALTKVDAAMMEAAAGGSPAATYLRLSSPDEGDRAAVMVLAAAFRRGGSSLPPEVGQAAVRWEALIADEVGDPVRAEVVRLVGDGLFGEALITGTPPAAARVERLVAHLRAAPVRRRA